MSTEYTKRAISAGLGIGALALLAPRASADTPFTSYPFPSTGAPTPRTMPDRLAEIKNVKDFGAVGDGIADDTAAIQAAFDAAFGPISSPNGNLRRFSNRPVIFPPGNYKITSTLRLRSVTGGRIIGSGSTTTRLFYVGPVSGVDDTCLIQTNGCAYSHFEGISFVITGPKTVAFDLNWDNTGEIALNANIFVDCLFEGASTGMQIGAGSYMGSENVFLNCHFNNNTHAGCQTRNYNALQQTIIGGSADNNGNGTDNDSYGGAAFFGQAGSFQLIASVGFGMNNKWAIRQISGDGCVISGCRSEGDNFALLDGTVSVSGCTHAGVNNGVFAWIMSGTAKVIVDSTNSIKGNFRGFSGGKLYLRGSNFPRTDYLASFPGIVAQNI